MYIDQCKQKLRYLDERPIEADYVLRWRGLCCPRTTSRKRVNPQEVNRIHPAFLDIGMAYNPNRTFNQRPAEIGMLSGSRC
jgi:hypothetical protein